MKKYLLIVLFLSACATIEPKKYNYKVIEFDDRCLVYEKSSEQIYVYDIITDLEIKQIIGNREVIVNVCYEDGDCKEYDYYYSQTPTHEMVDGDTYTFIKDNEKKNVCFIQDSGNYSYKTITGAKRTIAKLKYIENAKNITSIKTLEQLKKMNSDEKRFLVIEKIEIK
jgi:hypothetical protein